MNKILNINLGGYALTIDDDAYEYLSGYLDSIRRRFSESEGRDEIIGDIEARTWRTHQPRHGVAHHCNATLMPKLPWRSWASRKILAEKEAVQVALVLELVAVKKVERLTVRTGKRLFRDEDDAVVAGVCSGLIGLLRHPGPGLDALDFCAARICFLWFLDAGLRAHLDTGCPCQDRSRPPCHAR
jgi:phage shock protein C